jgi:hypothetical protein
MQTKPESYVKYFRPIRPGPESLLEAAVARSIDRVISPTHHPKWLAGSLTVGAGMPDLLAISWNPRVVAIADPIVADAALLAYLRAVGCARFDTIVSRLGRSAQRVADPLDALVHASVVRQDRGRFSLDPAWRHILPEVVSIEAKVADWRKAIAQAARNQLFTHRSFIALPSRVAVKAAQDDTVSQLGLGVLAVDKDESISVLHPARPSAPKVWAYYYQLAHRVAQAASVSVACHS